MHREPLHAFMQVAGPRIAIWILMAINLARESPAAAPGPADDLLLAIPVLRNSYRTMYYSSSTASSTGGGTVQLSPHS